MKLRNFVSTAFLVTLLTVVLFVGVWQIKPVYAATSFGYSSVGGSQDDGANSTRFIGSNFTLTEYANVTSIHAFMAQSGYETKSKCAIYTNAFVFVAESLEFTRVDAGWFWYNYTFAANPTLSAAQYFLVFWSNKDGISTYGKYATGDFATQGIEGSGTYGTFPSTVSSYNLTNRKYSVYADYEAPSATPPTFTVQAVNTTIASDNCLFSCLIEDNVAVDFGIFGTNNTGPWINETATDISGTSDWINFTKTLNDTNGNIVQYKWWANDTENSWANSGIQQLTIGAATHDLTINSLLVSVTYTVNSTVSGASVNAASGSAADIQTAINAIVAAGGIGTVHVPAGTFNFYVLGQTWTTINIPCGVNLVGAEPAAADGTLKVGVSKAILGVPASWNTILVMPYEAGAVTWFTMGNGSQSATVSSRFANIKLQGYRTTNTSSVSLNIGITIYGILNFRIDHCMFEHTTHTAVAIGCWYQQNMYCSGVIDHCNITNLVGYDNLANYLQSNIGYGISISRAYHPDPGFTQPMPYDLPMTMLGQYTNHSIFIENNYFSKWRHCVASGHSGYYVFRYNWINKDLGHYSLDVHGLRDAEYGRSGGQGAEVYENNFTAQSDFHGVMQDGGGYGVFFNNVIDSTYNFVSFYNEDAVASATWHIVNFFMWGNSGTWTPQVTYPTGSIDASRNVTAEWTRPAGSYGGASYPNVSASWLIASYTPYLYPMPLTVSSLYSGITNDTIALTEDNYAVTVPAQVTVGSYSYEFTQWQDASTNNTIIIDLSGDTTLTATYVESTVVLITINTPTNGTYTSSAITIALTAFGGDIDLIWWNCKNGTDWIYATNQTYPGSATMTGFVDGESYTFYAWANNTAADSDEAMVMFTVAITLTRDEWGGYWGRWWGYP